MKFAVEELAGQTSDTKGRRTAFAYRSGVVATAVLYIDEFAACCATVCVLGWAADLTLRRQQGIGPAESRQMFDEITDKC